MSLRSTVRIIIATKIILIFAWVAYGQDVSKKDFFYDFQVQYPPTYKISVKGLSNFYFNSCTGLDEIFEHIFENKFNEEIKIVKKSGRTTFSSAVPPDMFQTTKLRVEIDEMGNLVDCLFYGKELFEKNKVESFTKELKQLKFHPALKDREAVRVILYYIVNK